jgi:predicted RNase H-like HicB family nuclease
MHKYVAVVMKRGPHYSVSFPDLPGCSTVSPSLESTRPKAEEILASHIRSLAQSGQSFPTPTPLQLLSARYAGAIFFICTVGASIATFLPEG